METFEQMALRVAKEFYPEITGSYAILCPVAYATRIRDELQKQAEPRCGQCGNDPDACDIHDCGDAHKTLHPAPIPADMMLVPRKPTEAMKLAACYVEVSDPFRIEAYKAMIAAYELEQGK